MAHLLQVTANSHPRAMVNNRRKAMDSSHPRVTVLPPVSIRPKDTVLHPAHLHKATVNKHLHQVSMVSSDHPKEAPVDTLVSSSMANRHQAAGTRSCPM